MDWHNVFWTTVQTFVGVWIVLRMTGLFSRLEALEVAVVVAIAIGVMVREFGRQ